MIIPVISSEYQTVWIRIRSDNRSIGPDLGSNSLQRSSADDSITISGRHEEY